MADKSSNEGSGSSNACAENSDSVVVLNIKTLDSQLYTIQVEKETQVSLFKEKIAYEIGIPAGQQRLIFRGKVLKDDHLLSEYYVENGDTLHLVVRQQPQPSSDASSVDAVVNNGNQGNDTNTGAPRNRVGQISHSVVLGSFNVGDQGEGAVPDLSRVIGAVLNSFGVGNQTHTNGIQTATSVPQGNESDANRVSVGLQSQPGDQTQSGQPFLPNPYLSSPFAQIPVTGAAAVAIPSLHLPIPDSLSTLSEFMSHMEQAFSQNGYRPDNYSPSTSDQPRVELPIGTRGLPTPEALSIVMRHAQRLLSDHAITALSHIAECLEQEGSSTDPAVRGQVQSQSVQVGIATQHLGALLLELGRTILTLRMGHSPAESSVNAGPAVYISPSGPNPIMVQPFSLQTNSLFDGAVFPPTPTTSSPVGMGSAARHVNIHIHAGTSLAPIVSAVSNVPGTQGERNNETVSGSSGPFPSLPVRDVIETFPAHSTGEAISGAAQPGLGRPNMQDSAPVTVAELNALIEETVRNMESRNQAERGLVESTEQSQYLSSDGGNGLSGEQQHNTAVDGDEELLNSLGRVMPDSDVPVEGNIKHKGSALSPEDVSNGSVEGSLSCFSGVARVDSEDAIKDSPRSSEKHDNPDGTRSVPLGLGLGGTLERKGRTMQPTAVKNHDTGTSSSSLDQTLNDGTSPQQLLQSLVSRSSTINQAGTDNRTSNQSSQVVTRAGQDTSGQLDAASAMSQALQSPALDGLLAGISAQTGVGSPNVMRNVFQQFIENPQIMDTVQQIAQQVDGQGLEDMFSGAGRGQTGGFDLSRMVQQMMPVVSRAFGHGSLVSEQFPTVEPEPQQNQRNSDGQGFLLNTHQVAQMIEHSNSPGEVFHHVVENAIRSNGDESSYSNFVEEICNDESLAAEYIEMLGRDLSRQLHDELTE